MSKILSVYRSLGFHISGYEQFASFLLHGGFLLGSFIDPEV
jgi:hypothetical protein